MRRLIILLCLAAIFSCSKKNSDVIVVIENTPDAYAKNIILLIGDGMGLSQITGGMIANGMKTHLERFPYTGLHKSYSFDNLITDSAAGATAFSAGKKTYNGAIAVNRDTFPVHTILEESEERGLKTGLVATSTIVHATPASFIAHNRARGNYEEIASDFLKTDIDIFIGGGKKYFDRRSDGRNLYDELKAKGYQVDDYFNTDFENFVPSKDKVAYLTADDSPLKASQGRDYLPRAASMAVDFLKKQSDKGFFLMVEGSQIDWGGHANDAEYILSEFIDFDKTIGNVLDWAIKDGNTLVIVTADHETGGFSVNNGSTQDSLITAFTTDYHTATMIPVFAYGPGSETFTGIYENTAIYHKMRNAFGWIRK